MKKVYVILILIFCNGFVFQASAGLNLNMQVADSAIIEKPYDISFYPNPVTNEFFTVEASHKIKTVEIYNVIGQMVQRENNVDITNKLLIKLRFSEKGIYLVKVFFKDGKSVVKRILIK